uniref:Uncharacterized protein n=1 Tax=Eutreptiella gymnastica TaxID=73025 RepID=A0A7S4CPJ7_9EUGL|mmetsp:Transcript_67555/g.113385  ORF Transcript_67555/g.113385 Transcript_67555/m.113385 type:complete len:109 (-) Transcript_67555:321-647(-)|eukprot:CAMPEP_0174383224 /NCGR_PEP_ID=MMETSP0811_2-20130205/125085_1 /TAXON_ID=73025 ORGANISM="Eutreptiella gymnastica-like, Strain CCMP1594" /NCGR_SAMPLE_ID=MMETSP0811_2 /ASSEMBLY_ACC=CAM_ASM_000667 /LENGTH=108 /DNA_ID=CAMNT_0015536725 /DNA_START=779 /DNA_END=1105 /DNA_ORIENTATION=-
MPPPSPAVICRNARQFKLAVLAAASAKRQGCAITPELIKDAIAGAGFSLGLPIATAGAVACGVGSDSATLATLREMHETQKELNVTMNRVADLLSAKCTEGNSMQSRS